MMKEIKNKFRSLYWQQFSLIAGIVMLTLLLLGASFYALSYNYLVGEKRDEMKVRAQLIVQMSEEYLTADESNEAEQDSSLSRMAGVASMMTEVNFLICDGNGQALLTTDSDLAGKSIRLPEELQTQILENENGFEGNTTLGGLYRLRQFAVGLPVKTVDGQVVGMVLAMIDATQLMRLWRSFTGLFFMISAIVLLIAFVASSFMSMRQIQPIKEMLKGTRAYAAGNFDMRIEDEGRGDEIGELARSFNMMADSLSETERQRRDFIANISHELKTPMTSIAGYTDGILDGTIPQKDERKYLQIISDESHRLSRLVRRMLDISQIQSQEMHKEDFDLCESMRIALLSMEQKINQRGLDVEANIPEDSVMVRGDNELITQVVYNLLENATKYAAEHSTLYLGLACRGEKAVVTVRNTGNTIPAQEIPLLFERFHKSDKSRSVDKDGYGLGLYVVKTILNQHKEQITVTSENGVTAFSFTVQMADSTRSYGEEQEK